MRRGFTSFAALILLCRLFVCADEVTTQQPGEAERTIARQFADMIGKWHYSRLPLDDERSKLMFEDYLTRLDSQHRYFLQSDIDHFSVHWDKLDDCLKAGDVTFAYDVFDVYVDRVRDRVRYVEERVHVPPDFTIDEEFIPDRSEADWCTELNELDEIWRLRIKNNLLVHILNDERKAAQQVADLQSGDGQAAASAQESGTNSPANGGARTSLAEGPANGIATATTMELSDARIDQLREKFTEAVGDHANAAINEPGAAVRAPAGDGAAGGDAKIDSAPGEDSEPSEIADHGISAMPPDEPKTTPEERVLNIYRSYLKRQENKKSIDVLETYLTSLAQVYDPHSTYMPPKKREAFDIKMKLSLEGIGAMLQTSDGYIKVHGIIAEGPAEKDGRLGVGDRIIGVRQEGQTDSVNVIDMPMRSVVQLIRGKKGTRVFLTVIEAEKGLGSEPAVIDIVRDTVKLKDKEAKISYQYVPYIAPEPADVEEAAGDADATTATDADKADDLPEAPAFHPDTGELIHKVGIISMTSFYRDFSRHNRSKDSKSATRDVKKLLAAATEERIEGLLLDFRSNKGGSMEEAVSMVGLFIPGGPVLQVCNNVGARKVHRDPDHDEVSYHGPLAVLINRHSASSTEIFSAAIQDYQRGVIVGDRYTHGKGTMQTLNALDRYVRNRPGFKDGKRKPGTLRLTTGMFYRINGGSTQLIGVTPDIIFPSFRDHQNIGEPALSNPLEWNEINPLNFERVIDISSFTPILKQQSDERMTQKAALPEMAADISHSLERKNRTTVTLNMKARRHLYQDNKDWKKRIRKYRERMKDPDTAPGNDWVLDEALLVLADLIRLEGSADGAFAE